MRPLWWDYSTDTRFWLNGKNVLLGEHYLLVVGDISEQFYLPAGQWWDMDARKVVNGYQDIAQRQLKIFTKLKYEI